jgi:hypothetical protein
MANTICFKQIEGNLSLESIMEYQGITSPVDWDKFPGVLESSHYRNPINWVNLPADENIQIILFLGTLETKGIIYKVKYLARKKGGKWSTHILNSTCKSISGAAIAIFK